MKLRARIRLGSEVREEVLVVEGDMPTKAMRAAEALIRERNQHLPVGDREVLLSVTPVTGSRRAT